MLRHILNLSLILILIIGTFKYFDLKTHLNQMDNELLNEKSAVKELKETLANAEKEILYLKNDVKKIKVRLAEDFLKFKHIDDSMKSEILAEIWTHARNYKIDPAFLYAVLWKESRFRNDVTHKPTYVKALNKVVQAQGMGAIVWDFWGSKLIKNTSITVESDLKDWRKNIEGTAYILGHLAQQELVEGTKNRYESAASRYYGKYNHSYVSQTINKYLTLK